MDDLTTEKRGEEIHWGSGEPFSPSPVDPTLARTAGFASPSPIETGISASPSIGWVEPVRHQPNTEGWNMERILREL